MMSLALILIVVAVVTFLLYKLIFTAGIVDHIPGPKTQVFVGNAFQIILGGRNCVLNRIRNLVEEFQDNGLARLWFGYYPVILLFKPEQAEEILKNSKNISKPIFYEYLKEWLNFGLLTSTHKKWQQRRRLLTPAFHFRILEDFLPIFNEQSQILTENLEKETGKPVDIFPNITLCALDIICGTGMGVTTNHQNNKESEYVTAIYDASEVLFYRFFMPWLQFDFTFNLSPSGKRYHKALKILHSFTEEVIQERKKQYYEEKAAKKDPFDRVKEEEEALYGTKKRLAFLDLLIEYSDEGRVLSDKDIQEEVDTFMFEGHDTTAAGMYWTLFLLGAHPQIQTKVHEELDAVLGDDKDRPITSEDLVQLKYLECTCKEALRLYPSVPFFARKIEESFNIGNFKIPKGVICTVFPYLLHRDPKHFPNPEVFDPERFTPENSQGRHPYAYIPFSAGPRNCIGQKFALMEEKVVIAHVMRKFKITTLKDNGHSDFNVIPEIINRPAPGLKMILELR